MIAPTLKLGISVLSGGNAAVQQVQYLQYTAHNNIQVILPFSWYPNKWSAIHMSYTLAISPFQAGIRDI